MKTKSRDHNMRSGLCFSAALLISMVWNTAFADSTLEAVSFNTSAGGNVDVVMEFSGDIPEPEVFTTDSPARIAIDLPNTESNVPRRNISIGVGSTRSVSAVEAGDRTRVVIDLFRSTTYDTRTEGNRLVVAVQGSGAAGATGTASDNRFVPSSGSRGAAAISNIDFRRGANGEGRIIVDFDDSGANIDLSRQDDQLIANIYNASIPSELEQRLDVMDFATPVRMIESYSDGERVRMNIDVTGEFEHLAYQSGDRYVIEVQEYQEEELTPEEALLQEPEYTGTRVTFNFQDIPVRAVLQLIADVSGLNVVVADSVDGNITLRLQNVPWDQALDIILQAKGLDQRKVGNVVWIAPAEEIAAREQQLYSALQEKRNVEPLRSAFIQVNYAKATDLATLIREARSGGADAEGGGGILSSRGSVSFDERTNVLLVTDTQDRIADIRELVNLLDRPVRQVQIESRIVVATDSFSDELGARFGFTSAYEDNDGNLVSTAGSLDATDRMSNLGLVNRQINPNGATNPVIAPDVPPAGLSNPPLDERLNVNLPASGNSASWSLAILASDYLLDLELSALEQEGRGEIVSSPRLITANQKEASITQGVQIPYQESASSGAATISFRDAVLELQVQPLITPDDRVILDLNVKQDSVGEFVPVQGGGQVPSIDKREIETQVLVDSGQTVVLGGIFERERRYESDRVPVLGDIPGLGVLFRNRLESDDKSELLIFVTPTILSENVGAY